MISGTFQGLKFFYVRKRQGFPSTESRPGFIEDAHRPMGIGASLNGSQIENQAQHIAGQAEAYEKAAPFVGYRHTRSGETRDRQADGGQAQQHLRAGLQQGKRIPQHVKQLAAVVAMNFLQEFQLFFRTQFFKAQDDIPFASIWAGAVSGAVSSVSTQKSLYPLARPLAKADRAAALTYTFFNTHEIGLG